MKGFVSAALLMAWPLVAQGYQPRADLEAGRFLKAFSEADARLRQSPNDALAWAAKSQALSSFQRIPEALAAADRAMAQNPWLADALLARGMARGGAAVQQRNLGSIGKVSGAMSDLEAATKSDPGLASAWLLLGVAYEQLPGIIGGSTRKALNCADQLRKIAPAQGDALQGTILSMEGKWSQALPYFGRALTLAPADPQVVYAYLDALSSRETRKTLGDTEQKRQLATEALRLLPPVRNRAKALEAITDALNDAGQPEEAWRIAKEALPTADAPSLVRLQLGKLAAKSGRHREEGLAYLDQVTREPLEGGSGGYPAAWWRKGQILRDLGRREEAQVAGRTALKLDPKHRGAQELLN